VREEPTSSELLTSFAPDDVFKTLQDDFVVGGGHGYFAVGLQQLLFALLWGRQKLALRSSTLIPHSRTFWSSLIFASNINEVSCKLLVVPEVQPKMAICKFII